jgi:chemotaxis-related protein WspD
MSAENNMPLVVQAPTPAALAGGGGVSDPADCWNRVGIFGDKTCAELPRFVQCRNCPVYATAGSHLLQRKAPDSYRREWTSHYAEPGSMAKPGERSAVLFKVGAEWLALPTMAVQEVAERRQIHSLPHRSQETVLGLANVRGELTICISLGHLLGMERLPSREILRTQHRRLVVASWSGSRLAFPADDISGTERFRDQDLKATPVSIGLPHVGFLQGILECRGQLVGLIDVETLFGTLDRDLM